MNKEIEEAKKSLKEFSYTMYGTLSVKEAKNILQYIDKLETKVKELEKENTDIKEVYIRTAKHLDKKGHFELSEYMLAQIEATPTFTTWEEYTTWVSKQVIRDKIVELKKHRDLSPYGFGKLEVLQELLEEK